MPRRLTEPILTSRLRNRRFSLSSPGRRRAARRSPYRTARRREGVRPRRDSAHATGCPRRPARHARAESAAPRRSTRAPAQPSPHRWRVLIDPAGHPLLPEQPDTRAVRPAGAPPRAVSRRWNGRCGNTGLSRRAGAGRHVTRDPEPGGFETGVSQSTSVGRTEFWPFRRWNASRGQRPPPSATYDAVPQWSALRDGAAAACQVEELARLRSRATRCAERLCLTGSGLLVIQRCTGDRRRCEQQMIVRVGHPQCVGFQIAAHGAHDARHPGASAAATQRSRNAPPSGFDRPRRRNPAANHPRAHPGWLPARRVPEPATFSAVSPSRTALQVRQETPIPLISDRARSSNRDVASSTITSR